MQPQLTTPLQHHQLLHDAPHGTVIYWQRRVADQHWVKIRPGDPVPQLVEVNRGAYDRYVSVNEFQGWRLVRLLRSLRACYVDVDGVVDLPLVLDTLADARMPAPGAVVYSGRGLHLYWLLEPLPARALPVWQRVQDALIGALRPIGGDPVAKDCTRVLRVVGSRHSGVGTAVEGRILTGTRWTLHELADETLGPRRMPQHKAAVVRDIRPRQRRIAAAGGSIYQRWHHVYQDLVRIAQHQPSGVIHSGHRDTWLFLAAVALSWFTHPAGIQEELLSTARTWTPTLSDDEVLTSMKPVLERATLAATGETVEWAGKQIDPRYRFRRATLFKWCESLISPDLLSQLRAIIPDNLAAERKRQRDAARATGEYTKQGVRRGNELKRARAQLLRSRGQSLRNIATELGVDKKTIQKWTA